MKPQPCVCQGSALSLSHVASLLAAFLTLGFYLRMKRRDQRHATDLLCADRYDALSFFMSQILFLFKCGCLQEPVEGAWSPGVTGVCELPNAHTGN